MAQKCLMSWGATRYYLNLGYRSSYRNIGGGFLWMHATSGLLQTSVHLRRQIYGFEIIHKRLRWFTNFPVNFKLSEEKWHLSKLRNAMLTDIWVSLALLVLIRKVSFRTCKLVSFPLDIDLLLQLMNLFFFYVQLM